ncbi:MAG: tol-pal system protein YbgF [Alphaproteobacteria bacterium]|nr:tol-pal system protein YbgF [Alphaproteobacteria bacterium]
MKKYLFLSFLFCTPLMAQDLIVEEIPLEQPDPAPQEEILSEPRAATGTLDDLYTLVEEQKKALRDFTERLEQTEYRLKQTEEKLERTTQDLTFRVTELENKPAVIIDKTSDKDRYDYAYNLLQKNDYKNAEEQFLSFIKDFENSELRPNAIYWLGETYYAQQQFEKAVGQFADVFAKYPKSTKAPDALLKMGLSMISLNQKTEACTAFIALPNEYPTASNALKQRAAEEAKKNKCS